jgi:aryl-alcohol dehydrogenase-like predicted oxidoreductase
MLLRQLGTTGIHVSPIALGCWPIAGMSSSDVNDDDSLATIEACFELGINFIDTAFAYGADGESERLVARALGRRRNEMVIATKGGLHWQPPRTQVVDGRPETLRRECETSLRRLNTDRVELFYLHAPDPKVPIAESAGAIKQLLDEGKIRSAGVSNVTLQQLQQFAAVCPLAAFQPAYNMLQREIEADTLPWCVEHGVSVCVYWPLMKGLLAGRISRDHVFPTTDSRHKYPAGTSTRCFKGTNGRKTATSLTICGRLRPTPAEAFRSLCSTGRFTGPGSASRYAVQSARINSGKTPAPWGGILRRTIFPESTPPSRAAANRPRAPRCNIRLRNGRTS